VITGSSLLSVDLPLSQLVLFEEFRRILSDVEGCVMAHFNVKVWHLSNGTE
jgi:hypothetical protein